MLASKLSSIWFRLSVRPILMQLDLLFVEKVPFSTFAWAYAPKMLEISLPRLRMAWTFSKIYPELFSVSPVAQLQKITVCTFSIQYDDIQVDQIRLQSPIGSKRTFFSIRSGIMAQLDRKRADGDFLQLGPWRNGEQLWIDVGEKPKSFWGDEDQFPTFSGQKLKRTYWKVLFQQRTANPTA